jgi:hypothetical protein
MTHRGLHFVLLTVAFIIFACAGLVTIAERNAPGSNIHDLGQGLWWAMVTVATVGYGDRCPVTPFGQGTAVLLMLAGIGLIGVLTATFASYFLGQDEDKAKAERDELLARLEAARVERDRLSAKLDRLSEPMEELLRSCLLPRTPCLQRSSTEPPAAKSTLQSTDPGLVAWIKRKNQNDVDPEVLYQPHFYSQDTNQTGWPRRGRGPVGGWSVVRGSRAGECLACTTGVLRQPRTMLR